MGILDFGLNNSGRARWQTVFCRSCVGILLSLTFGLFCQAQTGTVYGPVTASFQVQFSGDPNDPEQNDVRVQLTNDKNESVERPAYFDDGNWKARFTVARPGRYVAKLRRNGDATFEPDVEIRVSEKDKLSVHRVQLDPDYPSRLKTSEGKRWFGLGLDLSSLNLYPLEMLAISYGVGKSGGTWIHVSASEDAKLFPWTQIRRGGSEPGDLDPRALRRWDNLARLCERSGVWIQPALLSASDLMANSSFWPRHPWNASSGGFLKDQIEFFASPEAKRKFKVWIRHAVARWGDSPSIVAWELIDRPSLLMQDEAMRSAILPWIEEMAAYVRSLDPVRAVSGGDMEFEGLDGPFLRRPPHLNSGDANPDKLMIGMGWTQGDGTLNAGALRDSLWAAFVSGAAGSGAGVHPKSFLAGYFDEVMAPFGQLLIESGFSERKTAGMRPISASEGFLASAIAETGWVLARIKRSPRADGRTCQLSGLPFSDGPVQLVEVDWESGKVRRRAARVLDFKLAEPFVPASADVLVLIKSVP